MLASSGLKASRGVESVRPGVVRPLLMPTFLFLGSPLPDRVMDLVVRDLRSGSGHTVTVIPKFGREYLLVGLDTPHETENSTGG